MELVKRNSSDFNAVVRAWRVARWAGHAWGNVPGWGLVEVWNQSPSLAGFAEILPGYIIAKGWLDEGPAGWGVLGPELVRTTPEKQALRVWIGSHAQLCVDCHPDWTQARYSHDPREAEAIAEYRNGEVLLVSCKAYLARPRDWARLARVLCVAYDVRDAQAEWIGESLRNMIPSEQWAEFDTYYGITTPDILVGPEAIVAAI